MKKIKDICTGRRFQLIFGAALLVLLIVFLTVYLLPSNRAGRASAKGDEFFAAAEYQRASEYYAKAISLKTDMLTARKNLIISDNAFDNEKAKQDIISADTVIHELPDMINEETLPTIIEIYLLVPEVYKESDPDTLIALIESGCAVTSDSSDLQPALSDAYALKASTLINSDIESAIEYDQKSQAVRSRVTGNEEAIVNKLTEVIGMNIDSDNFDKAYELIGNYGSMYAIDAGALTTSADAAKDLYETKVELLGNIYSVMEQYYSSLTGPVDEQYFESEEPVINGMTQFDFSALFEGDGSEAAEKLATSFTRDAYLYAPGFSSEYDGLVCGLYTYGDPYENSDGIIKTKYYFYFGEYKNGARNGYGISFSESSDTSYKGYEGEWKDDAPNGFGAMSRVTGIGSDGTREYTKVAYGQFENGIQTGTMNVKVLLGAYPEMIFKGTYDVKDGIGAAVPEKTDDYEILAEVPENQTLIAVLPSSSEGYNFYVEILQKNTETLSAVGF